MDIRAILLTGVPAETDNQAAGACPASQESFNGTPLALLPVLGRPVLHRIADRLKKSGIDSVSVIGVNAGSLQNSDYEDSAATDLRWTDVSADQVWRVAQEEFERLGQAGAELILLIRVGAYAEVELDPLIQFHLDQRSHITQVTTAHGLLDYFLLSASRRNDAAFLLRHKLGTTRVPTKPFESAGYVNRLRTAADLRTLAHDSLMRKTSIEPLGKQVRPGVWVAPGARVNRNVRLVAPCYVGRSSKVRSGSLITRGSSIEHHCVVDCGSVVEASTLLPLSYLGTGLDLTHSIVGSRRVFSVKYGAELEVEDGALVSTLPATSMLRTLNHAASLVAFVPRQIVRGLIGGHPQRESQVDSQCPPSRSFDPASVGRPITQERTLSSTVVAGMRE